MVATKFPVFFFILIQVKVEQVKSNNLGNLLVLLFGPYCCLYS